MDYESVELIVGKPNRVCQQCGGRGFLYWGNTQEYDVEKCECQKD